MFVYFCVVFLLISPKQSDVESFPLTYSFVYCVQQVCPNIPECRLDIKNHASFKNLVQTFV